MYKKVKKKKPVNHFLDESKVVKHHPMPAKKVSFENSSKIPSFEGFKNSKGEEIKEEDRIFVVGEETFEDKQRQAIVVPDEEVKDLFKKDE